MAKINYTQQEQDVIKSLKAGECVALNIKRIKSSTPVNNYSIEIRQRLSESTSFNLLSFMNPDNPSFSSSSGVRVGWMTVSAEQATSLFGVDSNALAQLPIDSGVTRIFIGLRNPSFSMPDGSEKFLQLQINAKLLSEFDPTTENGKYKHNNIDKVAKKNPGTNKFIKGLNKDTGEIEHIIEETVVKSSTMRDGVLVKDGWDHVIIQEYVGSTEETSVNSLTEAIQNVKALPTM